MIDEIETHIADLTRQMEWAYARFMRTQDQADRDKAVYLLKQRDAAILARSEADQAARHAAFEQRVSGGAA